MLRCIMTALVCLLLASPASARPVELEFWTTEIDKDRLTVIQFLADAFGVLQDDVTVKVVSVDEDEIVDRVCEAVDGGRPPELVGAGSDVLVALAETGYLDVAEASRQVRRLGVQRFYPGTLNMLSAPPKDTWYGVPFHGWVQGIWYRADWFKEAGLNPPTTWEDILAAARRFTNPLQNQYGILVGTDDAPYTAQVFTQLASSNGGRMFKEDGTLVFDSPAMVETLEFYAELARYAPPGPQNWRARDYFLQGKLAMLFYSTFIMDDLALKRVAADSLTGENFADLSGAEFDPNLVQNVRMVPLLERTDKAGYGVINGFGIGTGMSGEQREGLERFLKFLYDPSHYVTWLHMAPGGMLPVLRDVAESDTFLADPSGIFRRYGRSKIKGIIDGMASIRTFGLVNGKRQPAASVVYTEDIIPHMIQRVVFDGMPARESIDMAAGEIREIMRSLKTRANGGPADTCEEKP